MKPFAPAASGISSSSCIRSTHRALTGLILAGSIVIGLTACSGGGSGGGESGEDRLLQGGDTTTEDRSALAFENPAVNLDEDGLNKHAEGDSNFGAVFVSPPALFNAGLGPQFNNSSCDGCHTKNGRGQPVFGTGGLGSQAVVKISLPDAPAEVPGGAGAVPGFGTQLQDHATFGIEPEVSIGLTYDTVEGGYADGTPYQLRKPVLRVQSNSSPLPAGTLFSLRTAPPVFGAGLLEAIPDSAITALADPDDSNGDGISGRVNSVWDAVQGKTVLGRFGRKANNPNLLIQTASAYFNDMGVNNPIFARAGEEAEIDQTILKSVEFYVQTIAVPRAGAVDDPSVAAGEALFSSAGCASCHHQSFRTADHPVAEMANQTIFPYSDMLLHDMGEGLADGRPDFEASGTEWRTPPLWGIGITATILSSSQNFLHDGRGRSLEEAILWHSGEAENAKEQFRTMPKDQRDQLVAFLKSL